MSEESIAKKMTKCVFFNGIQHEKCKVGILYSSVRVLQSRPHSDENTKSYDYPCINPSLSTCDQRQLMTREQAEERKRHDRLNRLRE